MKLRKWLAAVLTLTTGVTLSFAITACDKEEEPLTEGPETGVYYFDAGTSEYTISLNGGNRFSFLVQGENKSGEYVLEGDTLKMKVALTNEEISATLGGDAITLTRDNATMRFLRKVEYTVTYQENGGTGALASETVLNGKTVSRPQAPSREGYSFIGWYSDSAFTTPFLFDTQTVSGDITLYAYWGALVPGQSEFTVGYDLNYEGAPAIEAQQTVGGKLYAMPAPAREGYTFEGWWISSYGDAGKLSYAYTDGTVFHENTTLIALWSAQEAGGSALKTPVVTVEGNTVRWASVPNAMRYSVEVKREGSDTPVYSEQVATTSATVPFDTNAAGDYVVTVTALAANPANNSQPAVRYYKNKALARVSLFSVVEPSALVFQGVENAERYYITIDCGNDSHNHTDFALGSNTNYNFSNCTMQEGGIRFTVRAEARGYASSESEEFVYLRSLSQVTGLHVDEENELVVWDAVPGALGYVVSVRCGNHTHEPVNVGGKTSFSLKECAAGNDGIVVSVYPQTDGYLSPVASTVTFQKTKPAVPANVRIEEGALVWDAINGATYRVRVNNQTPVPVTGNRFELSSLSLSRDTEYALSVMTVSGGSESLWSDPVAIRYLSMTDSVKYENGTLSWESVIGAAYYQIRISNNLGRSTTQNVYTSSVALELPFEGVNNIDVRYMQDATHYGDWVRTVVYAQAITFDTNGGAGGATQFKAFGDEIIFPEEPVRDGYDFGGWYNARGGASANGAQYPAGSLVGATDMVLYAYWLPKSYTYTYDAKGGTGIPENITLKYGEAFKLDVPVPQDERFVFIGWFDSEGGAGTRYTDEEGWGIATLPNQNVTLHAFYREVLAFTMLENGTYSARAGRDISSVGTVTIPTSYNGRLVSAIDAFAFSNLYRLYTVNIPNTVQFIDPYNAFDRCSNLREINIIPVEGNHDVIYTSENGVVLYNNPQTYEIELRIIPAAKAGSFRVPDGITVIPLRAFQETRITDITIPSSVISIEESAFNGCAELENVIFESAAENEQAQPLTIAEYAFRGCTSLRSITLPARITNLSNDIFTNCARLAQINVEEGGTDYASVDGMLTDLAKTTLIYCPQGKTGELTIPQGINAIADEAFAECSRLTLVTIPNYVTEIGTDAFRACRNLRGVTFGSGLSKDVSIGDGAFRDCTTLRTVTFAEGSGVETIGDSAFKGCINLTALVIPASLTNVGDSAFANCSALATVSFAENGKSLAFGGNVFANCLRLTRVEIPATVTRIELGAFEGCDNLEGIFVDDKNQNYTDIDGVLYDHDVTTILFYSKKNDFSEFTLPNTVTAIGDGVFANNLKVEAFEVPSQLTSIGARAFAGCSNLAVVTFAAGTAPLTFGESAFEECNAITAFTFPDRATNVAVNMFKSDLLYMSNLASVTLGSGIKTIGNGAFYNASSLSSINLPEGITAIGDSTFYHCEAVTAITLPSTLTSIGANAFEGSNIVSVSIPANVETLGAGVFTGVESLTSLTIAENTKLKTIPANAFKGTGIASVTIPAGITAIGNNAFQDA